MALHLTKHNFWAIIMRLSEMCELKLLLPVLKNCTLNYSSKILWYNTDFANYFFVRQSHQLRHGTWKRWIFVIPKLYEPRYWKCNSLIMENPKKLGKKLNENSLKFWLILKHFISGNINPTAQLMLLFFKLCYKSTN